MKPKQSIPKHLRYTVEQFHAEFPSDDACLEYVKEQRFPNGRTHCGKCDAERKHHRVSGRTAYACDHCGHHIYPLAGTIFEKSTTSLRLWFYAMYLMGSTRCGISAKQMQRELGVTYKTAWRIFRQVRTLLAEQPKLEGYSVEVDEMYHGGVRKGQRGRPMVGDLKGKIPVVGMVERKGGRVIAVVAPDTKKATLHGIIKEHVLPSSTVFTDDYAAYDGLNPRLYRHHRIKHSAKVYVMGNVHTQTIEGFWSLVKRGIGGVYHAVSRKYLQSYLNEYAYRYNRRNTGNLIFTSILKKACGRAFELPAVIANETVTV